MFSTSQGLRRSLKLNQLHEMSRKLFSSDTTTSSAASGAKAKPKQSEPSVSGLSSKVLNVPSTETGPGASKNGKYKNPEYFCYHPTSYFDAELEMEKFRLPQPVAN